MKTDYISIFTLFMLLLSTPVFSQKGLLFDENNIEITWELLSNNYNKEHLNLSSLTIKNTGKDILPSSGWTIYFNYNRELFPALATGPFVISHVNGDIYQLKPSAKFTGLKPDDSLLITYISDGSILNFTAAPCGMYIVWDANPIKGMTLNNYINKPIRDTTIAFVTPEDTYNKNKLIYDIPFQSLPKIFPTPVLITEGSGEFILDTNVRIVADPSFSGEANYLSDELNLIIGKKLTIIPASQSSKEIVLSRAPLAQEAYQLDILPGRIVIAASSGAGIFYGIQSLKSCMPVTAWKKNQTSVNLPVVHVEDEPRFGFRSLMLDVARNFQPKAELLKVIDLMSLYKLNTLHLHFCDDEGWRIEIPSLPELTEVGGRRGHTLNSKEFLPASYGAGPEPGHMPASGYYSRSEFIEILKFATERHIRVIPEIESPGHSRAAIKAMDLRYSRFIEQGDKAEALRFLLRDLKDESRYKSAQLWTDNVMCVALPSTYSFIEKVVDELIEMYNEAGAPLTTIHLGGDEVPEGAWEHSPACNALIANNPVVRSIDDLWYYYFNKTDEILKKRNLALSGWEEIAMRKSIIRGEKHYIPNPDFVDRDFRVHVWNNGIGWGSEDLPYRLANAGYNVVLSCVSNLYFDLAYEKSPEEPGYYWGGFIDTDKPFYFIPYNYYRNIKEDTEGNPIDPSMFNGKDRLTDFGKSNIIGIQGQLFAENLRSTSVLEYLLLPKLLALAERAWASDPYWAQENDKEKRMSLYNNSWSVFVNTLGKKELPRLDYYPGGLNYRIPPIGAIVDNGKVHANIQLPGFIIRYTTDGTEPTTASRTYFVPVSEKRLITFCAFAKNGRKGRSIRIWNK
ncbi:MAG: family 20 glycosylhydrolase [Bacteroidota bacterium]